MIVSGYKRRAFIATDMDSANRIFAGNHAGWGCNGTSNRDLIGCGESLGNRWGVFEVEFGSSTGSLTGYVLCPLCAAKEGFYLRDWDRQVYQALKL